MDEKVRIFGDWKENDAVRVNGLEARVVATEADEADKANTEFQTIMVPVVYKEFEGGGLNLTFWIPASKLKRSVPPHYN